jgi:23S rRNA pseudouridine2605 synthase
MIRAGRVTVNGRTVTELGTRANPQRDRIAIDGKPLRAAAPLVYILLNKPVGVVTTLIDPGGRPTVRDLVAGVRQRGLSGRPARFPFRRTLRCSPMTASWRCA